MLDNASVLKYKPHLNIQFECACITMCPLVMSLFSCNLAGSSKSSLFTSTCELYVTGFAKTDFIDTNTEINFCL